MLLATIRRRFTLAVMFMLFLTMLLPLNILSSTAFAQTKPSQCPQRKLCRLTKGSHPIAGQGSSVTLNPTQGTPGTQVTGTGSNWSSGDSILVQWDDGTTLATTKVQSNGTFTVTFTIPSNATQGSHTIYFTDQTAGYFIPATFTVGASTSSALTIQTMFTRDGNGNNKSTFAPGDAIQYVVYVNNSSGSSMSVLFHFEAYGPNHTYIYDQIFQNVPVPQGLSGWYTQSTVPNDAPSGTYTMRVHVGDQNNSQNQDTQEGGQFTVTSSLSVFLLAPFNKGVTFTVTNPFKDLGGYHNHPESGCQIGTVPDHCHNQLFGLDLVPDQQDDTEVLAPVGGTVDYLPTDPNAFGCMGLVLDDGIHLNVCHFDNWNVARGQQVPRGKILGTRNTKHVHLSLDDRRNGTPYIPIPFNGSHTIEGTSLDPNHDGNGETVTYAGHTFIVDVNEWDGTRGTSSNVAVS